MKSIYFLLFLLAWTSCAETTENPTTPPTVVTTESKKVTNENFQKIIDSANLNGVILIYDPQQQTYFSNDFARSEKGFIPASTFKIPNSIIALETGVVADENTLFKWDGKKRFLKSWEQDLIFREAFQRSCVPCYQDIARQIGVGRMKEYLTKLDYQNMIVDSTSIDNFWLTGDSKITAKEQINFISKLYNSKLPVAPRTETIMKKLLLIDKNEAYTLSGKTGWYRNESGDDNLGWFVGYIEKDGTVYFFATNVDPKENFDMKLFPKIRLQITMEAIKELGII